jgi:prefoldin subunit 5
MTIIVIIAAVIFIGGYFYLKQSANEAAEQIGKAVEEGMNLQEEAQEEIEALEEPKPKKPRAPRKKKEAASATEGPIKGEYYKQPR